SRTGQSGRGRRTNDTRLIENLANLYRLRRDRSLSLVGGSMATKQDAEIGCRRTERVKAPDRDRDPHFVCWTLDRPVLEQRTLHHALWRLRCTVASRIHPVHPGTTDLATAHRGRRDEYS